MEIKSTFTVAGETFASEQKARDHAYFLERKAKVHELMETIFKQKNFNDIASAYRYQQLDELCERIVKKPEIFRQALDIVEGK